MIAGETVVDSRGKRCPVPVIDLARAARGAAAGTRLVLLATDPAARHDVAAWCRMRGHALMAATEQDDGVLRFEVELS